jgi:hypothetical protein
LTDRWYVGAVVLGAIAPGSTSPFCLRVPQHRDRPDHLDAGLPLVWEPSGQNSAGVGFRFGFDEVTGAVTELAVEDGPADLGREVSAGRHGIKASMGRRGDCYDSAPMELFLSSVKTGLVH